MKKSGLAFKLCSVSVICQTPRTALEKRHGALCDPALLPRKHLVFRTRLVPCLPSFVARCPKMLRPAHLQLHRPVCEMSLGVKHLVIIVSVGCVVLLLCWCVMRCVVFMFCYLCCVTTCRSATLHYVLALIVSRPCLSYAHAHNFYAFMSEQACIMFVSVCMHGVSWTCVHARVPVCVCVLC